MANGIADVAMHAKQACDRMQGLTGPSIHFSDLISSQNVIFLNLYTVRTQAGRSPG